MKNKFVLVSFASLFAAMAQGETRLFYNRGKEKNLANCEMFEDQRHNLVGELMALLQYVTNAQVSIDDVHRTFSVEIER